MPNKPADCTCPYPAMVARNPSGHGPDCPVYIKYWSEVEASQVERKRANEITIGLPIPPEVQEAMNVIRAYLKLGNWVQVIINAEGGAVFKLTDIYDDLMPSRKVGK